MEPRSVTRCIAFQGHRRVAHGTLLDVALAVKEVVDQHGPGDILVFDDPESRPVELDLRGTTGDVARRLRGASQPPEPTPPEPEPTKPRRGRGRPKLGVVGREVTLLPRHWQWLSSQPGGASVTLRKLVDQARRANAARDQRRQAQESAYRFMVAMAGDFAGFEEATRALFAGDGDKLTRETESWPADVRSHARHLAAEALDA